MLVWYLVLLSMLQCSKIAQEICGFTYGDIQIRERIYFVLTLYNMPGVGHFSITVIPDRFSLVYMYVKKSKTNTENHQFWNPRENIKVIEVGKNQNSRTYESRIPLLDKINISQTEKNYLSELSETESSICLFVWDLSWAVPWW